MAAAAATKQLRWKLLEMFPQAPLKTISEAAKCGDFDAAVDLITVATRPKSAEQSTSGAPSLTPSCPPVASVAAPAKESAEESIEEAANKNPNEPLKESVQQASAGTLDTADEASAEAREALSWLARAIDDTEMEHVDVRDILNADKHNSTNAEDILAKDAKATDLAGQRVCRTVDGWEIRCKVDTDRPCQSLRTQGINNFAETVLEHVGTDNTAAFAAVCFEQMLQREQELEGEFCVFYHSYNSAGLIYEVEAEIARHAFGMDDKFAPLPRILQKDFTGVTIDDLRNSEGAKHQDCLPSYRKLAICASPTLFAFGSEAPPLDCFRHGYGIPAPLRELTRDLLCQATSLPKEELEECVKSLSELAGAFGLIGYDVKTTNQGSRNRLGGQMLQIFVHRHEVDQMVYNSLPYGVPIPTDSVERWLAGEDPHHAVDGQVRMLLYPEVFLNEARGQIFHYCGDWQYLGGSPDMEGSRAAFVLALRKVLHPVLSQIDPALMRSNLTGESDVERARRLQRDCSALERSFRAAAESRRAAAKGKSAASSGYATANASGAPKGCKKKGKKH